MARIKLCRSWRKFPVLVIILIVVIIIAKYYLHQRTDPNDVDKVHVRAPGTHHKAPVPPPRDTSLYMLPDDVVLNQDDVLQNIPDNFVGAAKCPACLGTDMCDELKNGFVRVAFPESPNIASQHGIYYGKWREKQIVMHKVGVDQNRWQQFEKFICENTTNHRTCDISVSIANSFAVKTGAFEADSLHEAYSIAHREPTDLRYTMCVSEPLVEAMKDAVGLSELWTMNKAAMLYTTMVVSQEVLLLKTASMFEKARPYPRLLGTCGQLLILQHQGVPLETYLSASWENRSELALQLLNMIDLFANGDVAWYVMYTDFRFENFDVMSDERVVIMDLNSMTIIDKESVAEYDDATSDDPCNELCFQSYLHQLAEAGVSERRHVCACAPHVMTDAMYASLCQHILSDLTQHKDADQEEADEGAAPQPQGLLHSPPEPHKLELVDLLVECVHESVAGSRLQAVEDLSDILQQYAGSDG